MGVLDTPSDSHLDHGVPHGPTWVRREQSRFHPLLVTNPAGDVEFAALAKALVRDAGWSPDSLARALYDRYPNVVIHRRELSSEPFEVWYVYRDGRWVP